MSYIGEALKDATVGTEPLPGEGGVALGIDIGGTKLAAGIGEEGGVILAQRRVATRSSEGAHAVLARAIELGKGLLSETDSARRRHLRGVGVSTMGITHSAGVHLAPAVRGWHDLRLAPAFAKAFPELSVAIMNDVKAAALAELSWGHLAGVETGIYVNLGTGISAAVVAHGSLLDGAHGAAGEIGYLLCSADDVPERRADFPQSATAPLEERYGGRGIAAQARSILGIRGGLPALIQRQERCQGAADLLRELSTGIGIVVANLITTVDPESVVIGGGITGAGDRVLGRIREIVALSVPYPPVVEVSRFGGDAALYGAVALGLGCRPRRT